MPIIRNQPLPDNHPFKNGRIVFGQKRPDSSKKNLAQEDLSNKLEAQAASDFEEAISEIPDFTEQK
jgi:hypothetical protein